MVRKQVKMLTHVLKVLMLSWNTFRVDIFEKIFERRA